jgi:hypothetical protein
MSLTVKRPSTKGLPSQLRRGWPRDLNMVTATVEEDIEERELAEEETESFLQKLGASTLPISIREFSARQLYNFQEQKDEMTDDFKEQKDEMTDDELRLWMLLAYARPCTALSAEVNVSVTQVVISRVFFYFSHVITS